MTVTEGRRSEGTLGSGAAGQSVVTRRGAGGFIARSANSRARRKRATNAAGRSLTSQ